MHKVVSLFFHTSTTARSRTHSQRVAQSIPQVWLSDDVPWMSGIRFQLDPQATYDSLDIVRRITILGAPYLLQEQVSGEHTPNIFCQLFQYCILDRRKSDGATRNSNLVSLSVDL